MVSSPEPVEAARAGRDLPGPFVSAVHGVKGDGSHVFCAMNAGPGLAIEPRYFGMVPDGPTFQGNIGDGSLAPGESWTSELNEVTAHYKQTGSVADVVGSTYVARDTRFIHWCKDVGGWVHIWGFNASRGYVRFPFRKWWLRKAEAPLDDVRDLWQLFHPDHPLPATLGNEQSTRPIGNIGVAPNGEHTGGPTPG